MTNPPFVSARTDHSGLAPTNKTGTPIFKNILLENVRCDKGATSFWIDGLAEQSIENLTLRNISMGPAVGKQGKCDFAECRCEASAACPSCCLAAGENRTECKVGARLGCFAAEKGGAPLLPLPHEGTDHSPFPTSMLRLHVSNQSIDMLPTNTSS